MNSPVSSERLVLSKLKKDEAYSVLEIQIYKIANKIQIIRIEVCPTHSSTYIFFLHSTKSPVVRSQQIGVSIRIFI